MQDNKQDNKKGFTLIEVMVAIIIFAFGLLSMAAFSAFNYMSVRTNQSRAKLHVLNESVIDDIQQWMRESVSSVGPTRFDSLWTAGAFGGIVGGDTLRTYSSFGGAMNAAVVYDTVIGTSPSTSDSKILIYILSEGTSGERVFKDSVDFAVANYGMGE
jgi:prepilin-type N-terminal cleavage/methylation domain-containing protein